MSIVHQSSHWTRASFIVDWKNVTWSREVLSQSFLLFHYFPKTNLQQCCYKNNMKWCWLALFSFYFFFFCFGFVFITPEVIFLHGWQTVVELTSSLLPKNWLQVSHHTKLEHRFHSQGHKWLLLVSLKFLAPLSCFSHTKDSKTQYSSNLGGERVLFLSCNYQRLPAFSSLVS